MFNTHRTYHVVLSVLVPVLVFPHLQVICSWQLCYYVLLFMSLAPNTVAGAAPASLALY